MNCWQILHSDFSANEVLTNMFSHISHTTIDTFVNELCQYKSSNKHNIEIADLIEQFHTKAGSLSEDICSRIHELRGGANIILMAHQPNIFPTIAIIEPIFYLVESCKLAQERTGRRYVPVFMFVDYDVADDKRFYKCAIPIISKPYTKHIRLSIPHSTRNDVMFNIERPPLKVVESWIEEIRVAAKQFTKNSCYSSSLNDHFQEVRTLILKCHSNAKNFSEFNEFILDAIVNHFWNMSVLFYEGHTQYLLIGKEFVDLINSQVNVNRLFNEALDILNKEKISVSMRPRQLTANRIWHYQTECKRRCYGLCDSCDNLSVPKTQPGYKLPDVICDNILDHLYIGKAGAVGYYKQAEHVVVSNYVQSTMFADSVCPQLLIDSNGIAINRLRSDAETFFSAEYIEAFQDRQNSTIFFCACVGFEKLKETIKTMLFGSNHS